MGDFGIRVSQKDVDVNKAKPSELLLNSYPFPLLDTTNPASFVNTKIYFENDPPNPDGINEFELSTEVYSFKHGYNYIPQTWFLFQNSNLQWAYGDEVSGSIKLINVFNTATFTVRVDSSTVHFYVKKTYTDGFGAVANISGTTLRIRSYVFANEVLQA